MLASLKAFLAAVPGSIAGILSNKERAVALVTALSTGNVMGVVTILVTGLGLGLSGQGVTVVTSLVTAIWTAAVYFLDASRRKAHDAPVGPAKAARP